MLWRWIALLAMVSSLSVSGAQGQQPGRPAAPTATDSTQSEISTRSTDAAIKVQVNLVLVRVVVREAGGKVVAGLKQEDFQVFDKGRRQKISAFSVETTEKPGENGAAAVTEKVVGAEAPAEAGAGVVQASAMAQRFLALVFDDSHLKAADAMAVHSATKKLFASLTPTDRVAIYSTHGDVQQDFTADAQTLRKTLAAIVPHPGKGEGQYECPNISYYQADLIVNKHDRDAAIVAVLDAAANHCPVDVIADAERVLQEGDSVTMDSYQRMEDIVKNLASMPGQRVLVYVSPGFVLPDGVMPDNWWLIERAIRAGVVVNTIDARGLYTADVMPDIDAAPQGPPPPPPVDSAVGDYQKEEGKYRMQAQFESGQVLAGMAASTGGRYFHNRNDLDVAMSQALAAPEVSYVLGFRPPKPDGKFHTLKVNVANGKKYEIQATNGYYASRRLVESEDVAKQEVSEALFSRDEIGSVPVQLKTQYQEMDATSAQLDVLTHLDIRGIRFRKEDGRSCDDLTLAVGLFDTDGRLVDGQMREVALKLKDSTVERMSQTGLMIKNVFTVKPGTYTVRSVVRESEGDQLTARNLMAVIPRKQATKEIAKNVSDLQWTPPKVDAPLKSLSTVPPCDLPEVLRRTAASAQALASNLEKFTAREHINYVMLDRSGMVMDYDSGSFQYVYSIERQNGGSVSREYRPPLKGSRVFPESGQDIGQAAIALIFLPELQTDYEMKCEGTDERDGQRDWVVRFQQRKDRPSRSAKVWVYDVARPGVFKGRVWISKDNFQVVHLEASLMGGVPDIGLEDLAFLVDYGPVKTQTGNLGLWLPNRIVTYSDFDARRSILAHRLDDFQLFTVETKEEVQEPKEP
jgi:VWFA-related protein